MATCLRKTITQQRQPFHSWWFEVPQSMVDGPGHPGPEVRLNTVMEGESWGKPLTSWHSGSWGGMHPWLSIPVFVPGPHLVRQYHPHVGWVFHLRLPPSMPILSEKVLTDTPRNVSQQFPRCQSSQSGWQSGLTISWNHTESLPALIGSQGMFYIQPVAFQYWYLWNTSNLYLSLPTYETGKLLAVVMCLPHHLWLRLGVGSRWRLTLSFCKWRETEWWRN